mmetsp:Transcript_4868/g.11399  ORF Transcript_4868/g.11399 Transcript_4868/m.11399 type:complete len:375 (-) Transcript_4868:1805-2929(-)
MPADSGTGWAQTPSSTRSRQRGSRPPWSESALSLSSSEAVAVTRLCSHRRHTRVTRVSTCTLIGRRCRAHCPLSLAESRRARVSGCAANLDCSRATRSAVVVSRRSASYMPGRIQSSCKLTARWSREAAVRWVMAGKISRGDERRRNSPSVQCAMVLRARSAIGSGGDGRATDSECTCTPKARSASVSSTQLRSHGQQWEKTSLMPGDPWGADRPINMASLVARGRHAIWRSAARASATPAGESERSGGLRPRRQCTTDCDPEPKGWSDRGKTRTTSSCRSSVAWVSGSGVASGCCSLLLSGVAARCGLKTMAPKQTDTAKGKPVSCATRAGRKSGARSVLRTGAMPPPSSTTSTTSTSPSIGSSAAQRKVCGW